MTLTEGLQARDQAREELRRRFQILVKEHLPQAELEETGPMQLRVSGPGLSESTVFLENLFRQISLLDSAEAESLVEQHVQSVIGATERVADMIRREQIVPTIKDQGYLDHVGDVQLVKEHLAADFWIVYAIDLPTRIMTLSPDRMDELALQPDELRALALANLAALIPPVEIHNDETWMLITAGSDYTASVLLLDEVWDQLADKVEGDLIVAVPTRDVLLATGAASGKGIRTVRAKAIELEQGGSYAISQTLLRRRAGRWIAFS